MLTEASERLLQEFAALEHDWDTYGALPIRAEALEAARALLRVIVLTAANNPLLAPVANGVVQVEGETTDWEFAIECHGADDYAPFFVHRRTRLPSEADGWSLEQIIETLRWRGVPISIPGGGSPPPSTPSGAIAGIEAAEHPDDATPS